MPTQNRTGTLLITGTWRRANGIAGPGEAADAARFCLQAHPEHYEARVASAVSQTGDRPVQIVPGPTTRQTRTKT